MAAGYPIYLHFLGYEKYGVWLVLAVVLTFAQLGELGINPAITKLIAEEYGQKNIKGIQCYITTALAVLCTSGITAIAVMLLFKTQIIALFKLNSENAKLAAWLIPYMGFLSVYIFIVNVFNATLSGLGRMDLANYIQTASKIIAVIVATALLYLGRGVESMVISSFVSYLFIQTVSIICLRKMVSIEILHLSNLNIQHGKRLLSFGSAVLGGSLISMLLNPFNKLILSRYVGVSVIPIYEIAFTGSMQIRGLFEAALRAMMPEISRIGATITDTAKDKILAINRRAERVIFFFGIPAYTAAILFMPFVVKIWLGTKYVETLPRAFQIMLLGTFLSLLCVPAYYTLMGLGKVRHCLLSQVVQGTVNAGIVGLLLVFLETISIQSMAWTVVIAMGATTCYVISQNRRAMRNFLPNLSAGNPVASNTPPKTSCLNLRN